MTDSTPSPLTEVEQKIFCRLMGIMIPADPAQGLPAANDPTIFADCISTLGRDADAIRLLLHELDIACLLKMDDVAAAQKALDLLSESRTEIQALARVVVAAYYRDDRVMRSYGRQPGPPFPKGRELPAGDWSLLEAVREMRPFWRDDRGV